ncbi:hypothetical protein EDC40_10347 [Aminobacter aminovorans]|uniref:Uncharacterized protein n=1 Tax=Aminobacter aminovorans TaxID=83263 RepID=A0A380WMN5_AMIAI|nr:hypothetical protein EDC40_10347 [Aminobacter aminovorans]SUU90005.1 Uncharacterised protein [Aminobacter aminovorans]
MILAISGSKPVGGGMTKRFLLPIGFDLSWMSRFSAEFDP